MTRPERRFQLLVEVKISSDFESTQIPRYLNDEKLKRAEWGRVIALTRDMPKVPLNVMNPELWLGIVRWKDLLPHLTLDSDEPPSVESLVWDALLYVAERPGDLGGALPGWTELADTEGKGDDTVRGRVARAALDELLPELRHSLGEDLVRRLPTRSGPRAWVSIDPGARWDLGIEIHGSAHASVSAVVYPPGPPRGKRRAWENAIRHCLDERWEIERSHLKLPRVDLNPDDGLPHVAAAKVLRTSFQPLHKEELLLRRFTTTVGYVAARGATANDLARVM